MLTPPPSGGMEIHMNENDKNPSGVSDAIQNEMLSELLAKLSGSAAHQSAADTKDNASTASSQVFSQGASPSPDLFSALLSNPELLAKLPSLLSTIKPIIEMLGSSGTTDISTQKEQRAHTDSISAFSVSAPTSSPKGGGDSRAALLCAIKPYLSQDRQNAIDYIIKISRLGDILKTL